MFSRRNSKRATLPVDTDRRRDAFESVYRNGHFAHLIDLPDEASGAEFGQRLFADPTVEYFRILEVMRDYGMYDRTEAPQYYPPVSGIRRQRDGWESVRDGVGGGGRRGLG